MKQLTKQKTNLHNHKLILSRSERISFDNSVLDDLKAGYPLTTAQQRAWDIILVQRQVKAGTFKSRWSL